MTSLHRYRSDVDVHLIGPGTFKGERRELPNSSRTELYFEYVAHCSTTSEVPASFNTFLRVVNRVMGPHVRDGHLHFRKDSEHAKCDTCVRLKKLLRPNRQGAALNDAASQSYSRHLLSQWLDRQAYWSYRSLSQTWFRKMAIGERIAQQSVGTSALCLIQDGMDQAKFKVPRLRQQLSKQYSTLFRPRLHVSATWLHGKRILFAIADEDQRKDSGAQIEQLARGLESVSQEYNMLPYGLMVQQDNTYREGKNRHYLAFHVLLVSLKVLRWSVCSYLRVGHSHEDIDQVFSVQAQLISRHEFNNPEELMQIMDTSGRPRSDAEAMRKARKLDVAKVACETYKLDEVALWKDWVSKLGIRLKGLRKVGQIRISLRKDIDASSYGHCEVKEIPGTVKDEDDVIVIAKQHMLMSNDAVAARQDDDMLYESGDEHERSAGSGLDCGRDDEPESFQASDEESVSSWVEWAFTEHADSKLMESFQGEIVVARFPSWPPEDLPERDGTRSLEGLLLFGDGSQKMLAAATAWISLLLMWRHLPQDSLKTPTMQTMIGSFLQISTMVKAADALSSGLEAMVSRIASQNVASRVQPITTFQFAAILKAFVGPGSCTSFDDCLQAYNGHPTVLSHDRGESGSGSIALDSRKKQGVKNWLERTSAESFDVVQKSCHDVPFLLGPYGESFSFTAMCFLQSKAHLESNPATGEIDAPLPGEPFVEVDWALPMTPPAQCVFFQKVWKSFTRASTGVPLLNKKRYRMTPEELMVHRNLSVLKTRMTPSDAVAMEKDFLNGSHSDFLHFLESRPPRIAMSMLPSMKSKAQQEDQEKQCLIHHEVEVQRQAVTMAQWKFFETALKKDQSALSKIQLVPLQLKAKLHSKAVSQRAQQADGGLKATQGYAEAYVKVTSVSKIDLLMSEVAKMKTQAADSKCTLDEVAILGWCDFNTPWSRTKDNAQALCRGIAALNEASPKMSASVLILPDLARDSNPRGLWDEERQIFEELFSLSQACEARFVECFTRESKKAEVKSNSRRFGMGRLVTSSSMMDENKWLNSELAVYGRVCGVNEMAEGAASMRMKKTLTVDSCTLNLERLYYLSVHTLDNKENVKYAKSRVMRELLDMWLDKRFSFAGLSFNDQAVALTDEELFASLKKEHEEKYQGILKDIVASTAVVDADSATPNAETAAEPSGPEELKRFESLEALEAHDGPFALKCSSETPGIDIIKGKSGAIYLMATDKRKILPKFTLIGGFGTGKYQPVVAEESCDAKQNVMFDWSQGDRTAIQVDMSSLNPESSAFEVMSLYKYLITLEKSKKVTQYELSYCEIQRQVDASGDTFKVQPKNMHSYRTMPDTSKPLTCKSAFYDSATRIADSKALLCIFRYRYDRVHAVTKCQKPYVMTQVACTFEPGVRRRSFL
ncbi:unnamed protein product [Durusdinium trenchii]|uniref:DUF7869 domain-containing protein n=1 Tax=Durusdinium trenchii TaxID=1381693 RepID=A0ABP0J1L3_9DINO